MYSIRRNSGLLLLRQLLILLGLCSFSFSAAADFDTAVQALNSKSFSKKADAIVGLAKTGDAKTSAVLQALLNSRLYYRKSDRRVVIVEKTDGGFRITDAATLQPLGEAGRREVKRIGINNKLRGLLRDTLARLSLSSSDPDQRYAAAKVMLGNITAATKPVLTETLARETDSAVRELLETALALSDLEDSDSAVRLPAIQALDGNLEPQVRNRLNQLIADAADPVLIDAAQQAVRNIEFKLKFYSLLETLFFGLSLGSVLLLAAIGLAITFGVMGVINMAHGELIMLGAYTTYLVQLLMPDHLELSILVAIPAAFLVSGLFGIAIERGIIRFLYGRPLETLLATFGVSLLLQQLVRTAISAQNVTVENPGWLSGSLEINAALSLTYNRLYILAFCILVFFALLMVLKKTTLGLQVRAVSQNRAMARAMGIRSKWVDAMTFGLGSGIAGVAGVALSQLTNVGPNMGQSYIIDSFMIVVFGGVGNLWGALVGAMSLGVANKILEPWSGAVLAKILVLVFIILFIQKRPRGLFPQKGRSAEN